MIMGTGLSSGQKRSAPSLFSSNRTEFCAQSLPSEILGAGNWHPVREANAVV